VQEGWAFIKVNARMIYQRHLEERH